MAGSPVELRSRIGQTGFAPVVFICEYRKRQAAERLNDANSNKSRKIRNRR
jgi:hypothetical protein